MTRTARRSGELLVCLLAIVALAMNLHLLAEGVAGNSIAGCGGGGCDEVLASRWSRLFGVPVTGFGGLVYLGLLLSFSRRLEFLRVPLLGAIPGAALWFVFVQAVILKSFCPWCVAAHGVGLVISLLGILLYHGTGAAGTLRRAGFWGAIAFLGIGLCQVYGPVPDSFRIEGNVQGIEAEPALMGGIGTVTFDSGRLAFDVAASPRLGPVDAERVLVEFFDYQCAACRTMAGHIEALVAAHPGRIAVLVMPVPLDGECNPAQAGVGPHPGSCAIARIALAVWRERPDAFAGFHKSLMASPSEESAKRLALGLMSGDRLDSALADSWIGQSIQSNIAAWRACSKSTDKLPKLLIRDRRILHGLPSNEEEFIRVMTKELGFDTSIRPENRKLGQGNGPAVEP